MSNNTNHKYHITVSIPKANRFIIGNSLELTEEEYDQVMQLIEKAVAGEATYLKVTKDNEKIFVPNELLKESIISIVEDIDP